jgi:hypothetical protein
MIPADGVPSPLCPMGMGMGCRARLGSWTQGNELSTGFMFQAAGKRMGRAGQGGQA